ncbi:hypothetical protein STEG23_015573 [Scotinomys teguina]
MTHQLEYLLLLQRTHVQFPSPNGSLQASGTTSTGGLMLCSDAHRDPYDNANNLEKRLHLTPRCQSPPYLRIEVL